MSTISTINNVQEQLSGLTSSNSTDSESTQTGETFEKVLDVAMDAKSLVLPGAASLAIDVGADLLKEDGLLSKVYDATSIKDGIENVFDELSIGIAGAFVAALSGEDSATATTNVAESAAVTTNSVATTTNISEDGSITSSDAETDETLLNAQNVANTKSVIDTITPYLKDSNIPIAGVASVALSALEELLLQTEEEKERYKS